MRVRTGIRAGFPNAHGAESDRAAAPGEMVLSVPVHVMPAAESRVQVMPVAYPQTIWQRLLSELQDLVLAAAERVVALWDTLRVSSRSRASPRVEVIDPKRYWEVDAWRCFCIGMMIFHHLTHSWLKILTPTLADQAAGLIVSMKDTVGASLLGTLTGAMVLSPNFALPQTDRLAGQTPISTLLRVALFAGAVALGWVVATLGSGGQWFILLMGLSMTLSYHRAQSRPAGGSSFRKYLSRGAQVFGWGLVFTIASFLFIPQTPILFGILHMLGLAIILAYPFLGLPAWVSLAAAVPIIWLGQWLGKAHLVMNGLWGLVFGIWPAGVALHDYWPLLPWFGVVLLGIAMGKVFYPEGQRGFKLPDMSETRLGRWLTSLSRSSLKIYVLQEPIHLAGVALLRG